MAVAALLTTTACGASGGVTRADSTAGSATTPRAASAIVVVRTGGIAGVHDTVRIGADGSAAITRRASSSRACRPAPAAVRRLRSLDLHGLGARTTAAPVADGFSWSVTAGGRTARATQADDDSRRTELIGAAAAVLASCQGS